MLPEDEPCAQKAEGRRQRQETHRSRVPMVFSKMAAADFRLPLAQPVKDRDKSSLLLPLDPGERGALKMAPMEPRREAADEGIGDVMGSSCRNSLRNVTGSDRKRARSDQPDAPGARAQAFAERLGGRKPGDGARPRRNSSVRAGRSSVTAALVMAADEISGTPNEQTLAVQQVAPWASSTSPAQSGSAVTSSPTDAVSCEGDAADAEWSPVGPWARPDVEKANTSSRTSQRLKYHVARRGFFLRCHVRACNIRYLVLSNGLER